MYFTSWAIINYMKVTICINTMRNYRHSVETTKMVFVIGQSNLSFLVKWNITRL